jgi:RNA-binding protein 25
LPTDFIEKLLKSCGEIIEWKRRKNEKGKLLKFGYVEYDTEEGVLKCLRLLNNFNILDQELKINPSQKTELFLKEWKELKRKEWAVKSSQATDEMKEYNSFDDYL